MTWRDTIRPVVDERIREARARARLGPEATPQQIARDVNANRPESMKTTRGWLDRVWRSEVRRQLALGPTKRQAAKLAARRARASALRQLELFDEQALSPSGQIGER